MRALDRFDSSEEQEIEPEMRDRIELVKRRLEQVEAGDVIGRIAAYNSEGVVAGAIALSELAECEQQHRSDADELLPGHYVGDTCDEG